MSEAKEFTGKTLDEAIDEACKHFDLERSKLEIEIISGGSSGIFGLVGKKKAIVKARPRAAATIPMKERPARAEAETPAREPRLRDEAPREARGEERRRRPERRPEPRPQAVAAEAAPEKPKPAAPVPALAPAPAAVPVAASAPAVAQIAVPTAYAPRIPIEEEEEEAGEPIEVGTPLDNPELEALLREAVTRLTEVIVGPVEIEFIQATDRVKILIKDEEQAGILIGREGQTLNALQYLVNRIVAKRWPEPIKIQLDTGAYRERQDDKLRQMALFLADKAKTMGRPQSTKPLSSYHRRVVHLALQSDESISTRSKGEGPMKRVIIVPKREKSARNDQPQA